MIDHRNGGRAVPRIAAVRVAAAFACLALAGCANPNFIGLQDYGTISGNVVDQGGKPIPQALVSATGTTVTATTQTDGAFVLNNVAVGEQTVTVSSATATNTATVIVMKNQTVTTGNIVLTLTPAH